jgi:hypothetical protein
MLDGWELNELERENLRVKELRNLNFWICPRPKIESHGFFYLLDISYTFDKQYIHNLIEKASSIGDGILWSI